MKRHAALAIALLGIPAAGLAVGSVFAGEFTCLKLANLLSWPELRPTRQSALSYFIETFNFSGTRSKIEHACDAVGGIRFLFAMCIAAGALVAGLLGIVAVNARRVGGDRARLAREFPQTVTAALILCAGLVLVNGAIAAYGVSVAAAVFSRPLLILLAIPLSLGALIGATNLVAACFVMRKPATFAVQSVQATRSDHPDLWRLVDEVARKASASPPDNILLGLSPMFFVTAVAIRPDELATPLSGNTLHLPLPLLRCHSTKEAAAVFAHEIAHFRSEDVEYTRRYLPAYVGIAHFEEESGPLQLWNIAILPAAAVLALCLDLYGLAERAIRRRREFDADRVAAEIIGPTAVVGALMKGAVLAAAWERFEHQIREDSEKGLVADNLSRRFEDLVDHVRQQSETEELLRAGGLARELHPTDTHPPLADRARALGFDLPAAANWLDGSGNAAISLVSDAESIERVLTRRWYDAERPRSEHDAGSPLPEAGKARPAP